MTNHTTAVTGAPRPSPGPRGAGACGPGAIRRGPAPALRRWGRRAGRRRVPARPGSAQPTRSDTSGAVQWRSQECPLSFVVVAGLPERFELVGEGVPPGGVGAARGSLDPVVGDG